VKRTPRGPEAGDPGNAGVPDGAPRTKPASRASAPRAPRPIPARTREDEESSVRPSVNPSNRRVGPSRAPLETGFDRSAPGARRGSARTREASHTGSFEADDSLPPPPPPPRPPSRLVALARAVFGVILVASVSGTVAWAARRYVMTTPRFAVTTIDVTGGHRRSEAEIADEAGLARGTNVFSIDLDRARARLLADPWISEATLARRLPGTLIVQVTEREAGAIVALGDSYLASRDGEIFKRLEAGDPADLPIVTGLTGEAIATDREGATRAVRRALDLASDYEHGPLAQRSPLQEVHLGTEGSVTLVVGKSAVSLALGEPPFRRKLEQAARVLAELDRLGKRPDTVMLDNEARPERVVVRMR
jgi:cell division protein FtsQ